MALSQSTKMLPADEVSYDAYIEQMRRNQYPILEDTIYLDHAGTSLPNRATLDGLHADMLRNLHANPHSPSSAGQRTTQEIENIRLRLLRHFNADPGTFDLIFTANTTAGIKLVADTLRDQPTGFTLGYHVDSHTSVVGLRELALRSKCVSIAQEYIEWQTSLPMAERPATTLFAYPGQSNMSGRRLPLNWCTDVREAGMLTLLDAASLAPTAQLNLDEIQPAFTVLSLSKMFGFPDLGALIIRKDCAELFQYRKYFGGGTVDMVVCTKEQWHIRKTSSLHEQLEDGSLPIHSILALRYAMDSQAELFGSLDLIAKHTMYVARKLYDDLRQLRHANGATVVTMYSIEPPDCIDASTQGPIVAFNLKDNRGCWQSNVEVDKLASIKNIQLRTGSVCNPGGVAAALQLEPWEMRQNLSAGFRCGGDNDIFNDKPTGVIRASFGPMSTISDVERFLDFVREFFVDDEVSVPISQLQHGIAQTYDDRSLQVESLVVYPIKSCAGWLVPPDMKWPVRQEGLAWDREWCVVHQGTGKALSQKRYARMALIRTHLDLVSGQLIVKLGADVKDIVVPLSIDPTFLERDQSRAYNAQVCDDEIEARRYVSEDIANKLSAFLEVECTLARFPAASSTQRSARHRKQHLRGQQADGIKPLLLSNESPILTITRSSLNALNETLKAQGMRAAHHSVFRANIILAEPPQRRPGEERPWTEDDWQLLTISSPDGSTSLTLECLGGCPRCQMVCIDQLTGQKRSEIFLTLAKTRRIAGKVLFGIHSAMRDSTHGGIQVGDVVDVVA